MTITRAPGNHAEKGFGSLMLISKQGRRHKLINGRQAVSGAFYTRKMSWFAAPVRKFFEGHIKTNRYVLDPFAGEGDLLKGLAKRYSIACQGYDLSGKGWPVNDSLVHIPNPCGALICSNPPYLAKHSAKRKGVFDKVKRYYAVYYDLYEAAIARALAAAEKAIFIIPETFLHSDFPKHQLRLVSVIEDNPFTNTENPVCAACFEAKRHDGERRAKIYIGDQYICLMSDIDRQKTASGRQSGIAFNDPSGKIALKAVDGIHPRDRIRFEKAESFYYGREKIKASSRLLTYVSVKNLNDKDIASFLKILNQKLEEVRRETADLLLSPFKGNNKAGKRRRRLDYGLARRLIERALSS